MSVTSQPSSAAASPPPAPRRGGSAAIHLGWQAARGALGEALLAATGGIALMLLARVVFGLATPTELVGDRLTILIPLPIFSALLAFFGQNAKHLFFAGLLIAQGCASAMLLALYWGARVAAVARRHAVSTQSPGSTGAGEQAAHAAVATESSERSAAGEASQTPRALDALAFSICFWVLSLLVFVPLITTQALVLLGSEVLPALAAGGIFVWLRSRSLSKAQEHASTANRMSRRRLLRQAGFGAALLAGTAILWELGQKVATDLGLLGASSAPPPLHLGNTPEVISPPPIPSYPPWSAVAGQTAELTPTSSFYYVSKNLVGDPNLSASQWQLEITGLVDHPMHLTLDALRALPAVRRYQTLECISNEVGGNLMSTTFWTGASLAQIVAMAGVQPSASEMIFRCADGYSDRHHLSQVLDPRALIVYAMDGKPLPQPHGYPARLLVPGRYGMKNGKWVTTLEFAAGDYQGYWEQQGWSAEALVKLTSRIDVPTDSEFLPARSITLAGVAFSGDQGIAQVDVSTDGGQTWNAAALKRPLSDLTWVLWELPWSPTSGAYVVVVRAIDLAGHVQTPRTATPLPDGASGYHAISVTVG